MKVKTSITLSEALIVDLERYQDRFASRSEMIEVALRALIDALSRQERDARDREIIEQNSDRLNAESADALAYQAEV